ncbi:MAG: carbohydrate kinase [Chloroflexota bacterium]|nr:MAG: carbohydrate kinase [Chloroflexota bacterium]
MGIKQVVAVDLGAESGRVVQVGFDGQGFQIDLVHRFPNIPVQCRHTLHWDVLRLWHEIVTGLNAVLPTASSIAVDTWGVDFALLDRDGSLLANPAHYRDSRTEGMQEWVFQRVPRRTIFERTGLQFMNINTLYQLASLVKADSPLLNAATTLLTIPDLFNYWLTGARSCEFTHVTTTQCYNPHTRSWDYETLTALNIPTEIFPAIVSPGSRLGEYNNVPVFATGSHDTASAVAAVPTTTTDYVYISSGTWSLMGMEVPAPVISEAVYEANITNEGGVYDTFHLLKNVMGLWIAQQCRAAWAEQGAEYSYNDLTAQAINAEPFRSLINPNHYLFFPPGDMPQRIREFCRISGQPVPETVGQIMRTVYESLALKYRYVLDSLLKISGRQADRIHIIGGGVQNTLLCQMTADATGRAVIAGPVEATALGSAFVQFIALGELDNIAQARELLSRAAGTLHYEPKHIAAWDDVYQQRFRALVEMRLDNE